MYTTLTPRLVVPDVDAALTFYEAVLGAEPGMRIATPDGHVVHAELDLAGLGAGLDIVIADLDGDLLARIEDATLFIDADAAGFGWLADAPAADQPVSGAETTQAPLTAPGGDLLIDAEAAPARGKRVLGHVVRDDDDPLFSSAVAHGNLLYLAGKGAHFEGDIKAHTDHVLNELQKEHERHGSSMEKVLKVNVYLHDLHDYVDALAGAWAELAKAAATC